MKSETSGSYRAAVVSAFATPITAPLEEKLESDVRIPDAWQGFSFGVISLLQEDQRGNSKLQELRQQKRVAVIYEQDRDKFVPQEWDIYHLINFLTILRLRASRRDGSMHMNLAALVEGEPGG